MREGKHRKTRQINNMQTAKLSDMAIRAGILNSECPLFDQETDSFGSVAIVE